MSAKKNIVGSTIAWVRSLMRNKIIAALFLLVQGITFIIWPGTDPGGMAKWVAAIIVIAALIAVISHFAAKDKTVSGTVIMVFWAIVAVLGVFLFIRSDIMSKILLYVFAAMTLCGGASSVFEAFKLEDKRSLPFWVSLVLGVLMLGLAASMVTAPFETSARLKYILGFVMVLNALVQLWGVIRMGKVIKKDKGSATL